MCDDDADAGVESARLAQGAAVVATLRAAPLSPPASDALSPSQLVHEALSGEALEGAVLRALTPGCAPLARRAVAKALVAGGVRPAGEDSDERRAALRVALESLCSRGLLRRTADKEYERVGGASAMPDLRDEEVEAEGAAEENDGGAEEKRLLSRPLSAAAAEHLAKRIAACAFLTKNQRCLLLFALRTANTDASTRGHSPLNPHAWNSTSLMNAWNKAHPTDEQLKRKYAAESLRVAVVSSLFFSTSPGMRSGHKLTFPNPCVCDGDEAMEDDQAAEEGEPALLSLPLSPATVAAIAACIESHPLLGPPARRPLLFALRTANSDTSKEHRSTPVNAHAWPGPSLAKLWSASHAGDVLSENGAAKALQEGVHTGLFCWSPIAGARGPGRGFTFPNPRFGGCKDAAGDINAAFVVENLVGSGAAAPRNPPRRRRSSSRGRGRSHSRGRSVSRSRSISPSGRSPQRRRERSLSLKQQRDERPSVPQPRIASTPPALPPGLAPAARSFLYRSQDASAAVVGPFSLSAFKEWMDAEGGSYRPTLLALRVWPEGASEADARHLLDFPDAAAALSA